MNTAPPHDGLQAGASAPAGGAFVFPAFPSRQRLWFLDQLPPGSRACHITDGFRQDVLGALKRLIWKG